MRHAQAHRRYVAGERLDRGPVEERARRDAVGERARNDAPPEAAQADIHADDAVPAVKPCELDLVGAHEPGAVDVDQLPVENVLLEENLLRAAAEMLEVELVRIERDDTGSDLDDLLRGEEDWSTRDRRNDARDRRVVLVAEADDEVVDAAEALVRRIAELSSDYEREVKDRRSKRRHR